MLYGEPRLTRDIDTTLGVDNSAAARIEKLAHTIHLVPAVPNVAEFVLRSNVLPLFDRETKIRVDLIFSFLDYERQAMTRANPVILESYPVKYASLEDVIIHKIFAGRPRDIEDAKSIVRKNPGFDRIYTERWLKELSRSVDKDLLNDLRIVVET